MLGRSTGFQVYSYLLRTAGITCLPARSSQPGLGYNQLSGQLLPGAPNSSSLTSCQWTSSPALCWVSPHSLFEPAMTALAVRPAVYSEGFEGQGIWGRLI